MDMNMERAMEIMGITLEEAANTGIVKLSRKFATMRANCTSDEEADDLIEAFDYIKFHLIELKNITTSKIPEDFFPKLGVLRLPLQNVGPTMCISVEGKPLDIAILHVKEGSTLPVFATGDIKSQDTLYIYWDNNYYSSVAMCKNISQKEYDKRVGV